MGLLSWLLAPIIDKRIAAFQSNIMKNHVTEVEHIYSQMRGWRHDYHNHMQVLKAHLYMEQHDSIEMYLDSLTADLAQVDTIIKSGNVMIDAILNCKLSLAQAHKIHTNAKAMVPKSLGISEIDLCIIIGNLLDNAMEACMQLPDSKDRFIRVYIDIIKTHLYITVSNSLKGTVIKSGLVYPSTKERRGHGFGLMRIDKITAKYGGYLNRQHEEGVFVTEIMLPV